MGVYEGIKAGLEDALAYERGKPNGCIVHTVSDDKTIALNTLAAVVACHYDVFSCDDCPRTRQLDDDLECVNEPTVDEAVAALRFFMGAQSKV